MKPWHFGIVTPSYNQGHLIGETLESIVSQKSSKNKIHSFVFDSKSSDTTVTVLRKFRNKIVWESRKDKGQVDAINKGLKAVRSLKLDQNTTVVAYINSDDYYLPGAFDTVRSLFENNPEADWVIGDCVIVDAEGKEIQPLVRKYKYWWRKVLSPLSLLIVNPIPQPAVFFRLRGLTRVGDFNPNLHFVMDYEYWHRSWKVLGKPLITDASLAAFRIHATSKGSESFKRQFAEQLAVAEGFTANKVLLSLQKLHNFLIISMYSFIKP